MIVLLLGHALAWEVKQDANGNPVHWPEAQIKYSIHTDVPSPLEPEAVREAINGAAMVWELQSSDDETQKITIFNFDGETKKKGASYTDNVHSISFKDNWNQDPELLAVTYIWYNSDGELMHFDIEINSDNHSWTTSEAEAGAGVHDLQNALTHEFGHALGLEHSEVLEATMAPNAEPGERSKRELHSDDHAGLLHLYSSELPNAEGTTEAADDQQSSTGQNSVIGGETPEFEGPNGTGTGSGNGMVALDNAGCSNLGQHTPQLILGLVPVLAGLRRRKN